MADFHLPERPPRLQDLPSAMARLCLGLETRATELLAGQCDGLEFKGLSLVVACSGGADSTALTVILSLLARRNALTLTVAHLDHGLRDESAQDALFVAKLCAFLGLELVREHADVAAAGQEQGQGLEEAGRAVRYAFLERVRDEKGADFLCTAHQLNDLAEDQLLRLMRGTAWPGLSGMAALDPERRLLRPLLFTPKAELTALLQRLGIPWREDSSNQLRGPLRNRVRHTLLPLFLKENPNFLQASARLWEVGLADTDYWDREVAAVLSPALPPQGTPLDPVNGLILDTALVRALPQALRLRLYKAALDALGPGQALADALFILDRLVMDRKGGSQAQFPGDKRAALESEGLRFFVLSRG